MLKKRRLIPEEDLPPINFSLKQYDINRDEKKQLDKREPFFQSFFDQGIKNARPPDIEKKLIV